MLGDDKDSRIAVLSDRAEATFRIHFADESKPALDILMEDFIDEKSAKAKGKRVSTLEIASIEDITPEPEVSPDETGDTLDGRGNDDDFDTPESPESLDTPASPEPAQPTSLDIDGVKMTIEKPKDTQLDLF
jgi:topoisomerase-4 subunit A